VTSGHRVTVSLVTYNALHWLPACLASLWEQTLAPVQVIIRDNASSDGTADWLRREVGARQGVELVLGGENTGFARAHNDAIRHASGEFVCLLNQDIVLDGDFLATACDAFERPEVGSVQGKLYRLRRDLRRTDTVDSAGLAIGRNRRVVSRGQGRAGASDYTSREDIFGADGACPVYRRSALESARISSRGAHDEYFDEDFFMYKEDVDLAWRMRLFGWSAAYIPEAVAWHGRGAGESAASSPVDVVRLRRGIPGWIRRISWRNQRLMQLKNETPGDLLRDLPWILWHEVLALAYLVVFDPRNVSAIAELGRLAPAARRKRRQVQARRITSGISDWVR